MAKHSRIKLGSNSNPKKASTKGSGEVIEVHGSRIVRSTGRKDRHSKVCTARGTRDRRVRLSPNTAIQFYDVQDRLGYDRPSKAIDWLMKEAKSAIDALYPENGFLQSQQEDYTNSSSFFSMLNGGDHYSQLGEGLNCHSFQDLSFPFGGNGQQCLFPSALNPEPLHFPYHHHQELNYHREPLQSSFSTSSSFLLQAPLLNNHQIPSLNNYSCLRYSNNDGLLEVTASARNHGDEKEQNQSSMKPSSAASLLHFQN